jgi:hypothetical protein
MLMACEGFFFSHTLNNQPTQPEQPTITEDRTADRGQTHALGMRLPSLRMVQIRSNPECIRVNLPGGIWR